MSRTALVAGASGLVGGHLLRSLLADATYTRVVMLGRRQIETRHPKLEQRVVDFGALDAVTDVAADDAFCCLGTTIKTAGSQEEAAVRQLPYRGVQIFRPSFLMGHRAEGRLAERIALPIARAVAPLLIGPLRRYRPIDAADVARAMVQIAKEAPRGPNVFEYDGIIAAARSSARSS
jgi:uncharacterized protein YbjT (DUF2867 family)